MLTYIIVVSLIWFGAKGGHPIPPVAHVDANCTDKLHNCDQFAKSFCSDVNYLDWAKEDCPKYCGICVVPNEPATTVRPCADKITNCAKYPDSACTDPQYADWAYENCRYHCRLCSDPQLALVDSHTTPKLPPMSCLDKTPQCDNYNKSNCVSAPDWAREYCPDYCGICKNNQTVMCRDELSRCKDYGHDVCSNPTYTEWALHNCRYWCRLCTDAQLAIADALTTLTVPPSKCVDKLKCSDYQHDVCEKYKPWAADHCMSYCGLCIGISTPPPACVDNMPHCDNYDHAYCTDGKHDSWAKNHCKKYCGLC